ncbi:unnamed protein product [Phytophthora lilii]|uniref:Unnamed protein product n=1 Tax=Phytophthora lilii TaxID=2077276 RepID=A0A9W6WZP3_9STRA|nr:unnamed protein product [Phytophthora lilii]
MEPSEQDETPPQSVDDAAEDEEEVEIFSAAAASSPATRYHEVTVPKPFGCFHLMQLIEKSIQVGALFSPKLFVPKEIWQQDRVKLAGVPLKVEVFHQLKQGLEKTSVSAVVVKWLKKRADCVCAGCNAARTAVVVGHGQSGVHQGAGRTAGVCKTGTRAFDSVVPIPTTRQEFGYATAGTQRKQQWCEF